MSRELAEKVESRLASLGRHTYLYEPKDGENYVDVVYHLNEAGIIVLLVRDHGNENMDREKELASEFENGMNKAWLQEIGTDVSQIVEYIKKETAFSNFDSLEGDYI